MAGDMNLVCKDPGDRVSVAHGKNCDAETKVKRRGENGVT